MNKKALAALLLAGLLPLSAQAHRTWLLPSSTVVDGKEPWVAIDAAVSENLFDFDHLALKLDDLVVLGPDGNRVAPENSFTGKLRSSFELKLVKPGTYRASVVSESVLANYKLNGEAKRWRGSPANFPKDLPVGAEEVKATRLHNRLETFVTAGKPSNGAFKSSGSGLEMVPVTHPNELMAGEKATFRLLIDGKPAANLPLSVVPGGVRYRGTLNEIRLSTDADGRFTVDWPAAGMYWVSATYPAAGQPAERRLNYSATLEVLPQ
jgi:uncharacterized GH25 family protein